MVSKAFQLLLFLSPICYGINIDIDLFDLIFFRTGAIILFTASLFDSPKRVIPTRLKYAIAGLIGICLLNAFAYNFQAIILKNFLNIFLAIVSFCIVYIYLDDTKSLVRPILTAGGINLCLAVCQYFGYDPVFNSDAAGITGLRTGGFLGNGPRLANYGALLIPFLRLPWALISAVGLLLLTDQYVVLIPVAIILIMKIWPLRDYPIKTIVVLIAAVLSLWVTWRHLWTSFISVRILGFWAPGVEAFFDRPLLGFGLGVNVIKNAGALFNDYLQFVVGVGILGLIWIGYVFKNGLIQLGKDSKSAAILTLLFLAFIDYPLEMLRLWYLIIAITIMFSLRRLPHNIR